MYSNVFELHLAQAVKNQYIYKLRANSGWFCALVLAQVIGLLFFFGGSMSGGMSNANVTINYVVFSGQIAVIFTEIWAFVISILLAARTSRDAAFAVAGNRLSDFLSDMAFIVTGCVYGGISSALFGAAMRVPVYLLYSGHVMENGFYPNFADICTIAVSTMLYMLLISAMGYLAAVLFRIHKAFIVIYPALLIGAIYLEKASAKSRTLFRICWSGIIDERSLGLFALRVAVVSVIILAAAAVISNRMEVRK